MKYGFFLLLILALTSCNSFERMKYRHLKKVPASPQEYFSSEKLFSPCATAETTGSKISDSLLQVVPTGQDCAVEIASVENPVTVVIETVPSLVLTATSVITSSELHRKDPIRRDWSLLIGLLFLAGGLIALSMCIFYYPFAGINFLWTIIFELFTLYAAWRLIGTGIVYFITRFRRSKSFSER